jgi:L-ascorbate metabolism protein UlaG (beta-lactamase superfamily)
MKEKASVLLCVLLCLLVFGGTQMSAKGSLQADTIVTSSGSLIITFIGHGTLMMQHAGKTIHIDPWGKLADYATLPRADLVLITHHHGDHLDKATLSTVCTDKTVILQTRICAKELGKGIAMANGERRTEQGIAVEAIPAYNIVQKRPDGTPFHPKGEGNGYLLTFGKTRVYVAGDTENTPEMKALKNVDIAFLPMNLPYTMTPEMVADAARAFRPKILYPYHYGETNPGLLVDLLKDMNEVDIRIRNMQ